MVELSKQLHPSSLVSEPDLPPSRSSSRTPPFCFIDDNKPEAIIPANLAPQSFSIDGLFTTEPGDRLRPPTHYLDQPDAFNHDEVFHQDSVFFTPDGQPRPKIIAVDTLSLDENQENKDDHQYGTSSVRVIDEMQLYDTQDLEVVQILNASGHKESFIKRPGRSPRSYGSNSSGFDTARNTFDEAILRKMDHRGQHICFRSGANSEHFKSLGGGDLPYKDSLCQSFKRKLPELDIDSIERENQEGDPLRSYVLLLEETLLKNGIEVPVQGAMIEQMLDLEGEREEKLKALRMENINLKRQLNKEIIQARKEREELIDQHSYDIRRLERQFTTEMKERDQDYSLLQESLRDQLIDELKERFELEVKQQLEHQRQSLQMHYQQIQVEQSNKIAALLTENKKLKERMTTTDRQRMTNKSRLILSELELQSQDNFKTEDSVTLPIQNLIIQSFTSIGLGGVGEEEYQAREEEVFSIDDQILEEDSISNIQSSALQSQTKNLAGKLRQLKSQHGEEGLSRNNGGTEVFPTRSLPFLEQSYRADSKVLHTDSGEQAGRRVVLCSFGSDAEERKPERRFRERGKRYGDDQGDENLLETLEGGIESARKMFQKG